jgi:hypothetical protein
VVVQFSNFEPLNNAQFVGGIPEAQILLTPSNLSGTMKKSQYLHGTIKLIELMQKLSPSGILPLVPVLPPALALDIWCG